MEKGTSDEKRKALLNIYWFLLAVFAVLSAVNLFAISKDSVKAAAIVNLVLMIVIPVVFVLGYIDFRNFSPLSNNPCKLLLFFFKYQIRASPSPELTKSQYAEIGPIESPELINEFTNPPPTIILLLEYIFFNNLQTNIAKNN